jgi:hypothetical protein
MLLAKEHRSLVVAALSGTLPELLRRVEKNLWSLRLMFWRRRAIDIQRQRLEKIQNLLNMSVSDVKAWRNFDAVHGVVVVPDDATSSWVLHTIVNGLPRSTHQIRGDWRQRLIQGGFGKRLVKRMYKEIKAVRDVTPPTKVELARMNAVMWWIHYGKSKDSGVFLEIEELEHLITQKITAEATEESGT